MVNKYFCELIMIIPLTHFWTHVLLFNSEILFFCICQVISFTLNKNGMKNAIILNIFKLYMSVDCVHKRINVSHLFMLIFKYTSTSSSHFTCSFKLKVLTKITFINCVVMVYYWINLVLIYLQTSKNMFLQLWALVLKKRRKLIPFFKISWFKSVNWLMTF